MMKRMMQNRTVIASAGVMTILCLIVYLSLQSELDDVRRDAVDTKPVQQQKQTKPSLNPSQSVGHPMSLILTPEHLKEQQNSIQAISDSNSKLASDESLSAAAGQQPPLATGQEDLMNSVVIIYNRVPKTGSTSFMGMAYDLCASNRFHVLHVNTTRNSHILSLEDQRRFAFNTTNWKEMQPAVYHGHVAFVDFAKFGLPQPIYINLIRDPIQRLVSHYYFLRFGDDFRPYVVRKKKGNKVSFDDCVLRRKERDCDPVNMWLQIPFFCGQSFNCWIPGSEWALEQAKRNLLNEYLLVGVTEEMRDFVSLLEVVLPRFFSGITAMYDEGRKSHLRKTYNKIEPLPETVRELRRSKVWRMEQEFYDFALDQFRFLKKQTFGEEGDDGDHLKHVKRQQFFYEKIRPK